MKLKIRVNSILGILTFFLVIGNAMEQHINNLNATIDQETKEISIQQEFTYKNTSKNTLETLYFNDWANAYSNKNTALAKSFAEQFKKSLHLAKNEERGFTKILTIVDDDYRGITWERSSGKDILKVCMNLTKLKELRG